MPESIDTIRFLFPWLPEAAVQVYYDSYIESGSAVGWEAVRRDSRYEQWFPGNLDENGQPRYDESQYASIREGYRDVLRSVGITATDLFEDQFTRLMEGEVTPPEFSARVNDVFERVVSASEAIQSYYSDNYGVEGLTIPALLAGALDPNVGSMILSQQISAAEIGGEALESGFNLTMNRVEELVGSGMTRASANELFQEAEGLLPVLNTLATRHNDPDDDFDLEEFIAADFFKDPQQNLRMRRMISQERAMFRGGQSYATDREGGLSGLVVA
jgi:hypothetical protein